MRHIKETALIATALLLCLSGTAGAEYIDSAYYSYSSKCVEINGRFFDNSNDTYATVFVLKSGGDIKNINDSLVEKQDQVKIKDGVFNFSFPLSDEESGSYIAYVEAGSTSRTVQFTYTENIDSIVSEILAKSSDEEFAKAVLDNAEALNISDSIYADINNKIAVGKMAYGEKNKAVNADTLRDLIKAYSYVQALNESKSALLLDGYNLVDEKILGFDTLDNEYKVTAYSLYNNSVKDTAKTDVFKRLENKNFASVDEMKKNFIYNAAIAAVKQNKNSGTSHIKSVLNDNNSVIGFDLTNYNKVSGNKIDLLLINGSEWEKNDIQKLLNTVDSSKNDTKGDIGGGTSGENTIGGGKNSGNYSQTYPVIREQQTITFADIDENTEWAREAIEKLAGKGIVNGRSENTFAPAEYVKRAEFLKMILAVFNLKTEAAEEIDFADVSTDKWYYDAVKTAAALNIAGGYGNGYFGAEDFITRQDAAVIVARAAQSAGFEMSAKEEMIDFNDKADISEYAIEATEKLVRSGILHGDETGNFKPKYNCTRAQAAVMLANVLGLYEAMEG